MKIDCFQRAILQECASLWQFRIDQDPELAAAIGCLPQRQASHALDPRSLESFEERSRHVSAAKKRFDILLTEGDLEALHPDLKLTAELFVDQLNDYCKNFKFR